MKQIDIRPGLGVRDDGILLLNNIPGLPGGLEVKVQIPDGYSAQLETGTVNGGLNIDFPITVQGKINRKIEATLGGGGRLIRVMTTNGGVRISRT